MKAKRYFNMGALALTLLAMTTSCQQDEVMEQTETTNGCRIIQAVMEQPADARTAVDPASGSFSWTAGDPIQLLSGTKGANGSVTTTSTTITSVDADGKGTFSLGNDATDVIGAVYPAIFADGGKVDDNGVPTSVTLLREYTYGSVNAPMYAVLDENEDNTAKFKHLGGVMAITVTNVPTNAVRFAFQTDKQITGTFEVKNSEGNRYIEAGTDADGENNSVAICFDENTTITTTMTFLVPLPVGEYTNFTVKLYDADGEVYSKTANLTGLTTTKTNKIERRTLGILPDATLEAVTTHYTTSTDEQSGVVTYIVNTGKGLKDVNTQITTDISTYSNCNITLADDIILPTSGSYWTPIGTGANKYVGEFNGNHKMIKGLVINSTAMHQGLIGSLGNGGKILNVTLNDCSVTSTNYYVGGIAGSANSGSIISGCKLIGGLITSTYLGNFAAAVGGIVGISVGTVTSCRVSGTVTITGPNGACVGGIVGTTESGTIISNCNVTASPSDKITITAAQNVGGIVGQNRGNTSECKIINNSNDKGGITIEATNYSAGGITGIGTNVSGNTVSGCEAINCTVKGKYYVGGILGRVTGSVVTACFAKDMSVTMTDTSGSYSNTIGGITGANGNQITGCFACGTIISGSTEGANADVVGVNSYNGTSGTITQCYYVASGSTAVAGFDTNSPATAWEGADGAMAVMNDALGDNCAYKWTGNTAAEAKIETK